MARKSLVALAQERDRIILAIARLEAELRRLPTAGEVADDLGMPRRTLRSHVAVLVKEGQVERVSALRVIGLHMVQSGADDAPGAVRP